MVDRGSALDPHFWHFHSFSPYHEPTESPFLLPRIYSLNLAFQYRSVRFQPYCRSSWQAHGIMTSWWVFESILGRFIRSLTVVDQTIVDRRLRCGQVMLSTALQWRLLYPIIHHYYRYRLQDSHNRTRRKEGEAADLGHSRARALPHHHDGILSRCYGYPSGLRCDRWAIIPK